MKKNNKGNRHLLTNAFTLIELLAVIIILAVVALIATPIVLDVIEDARISTGRSEANIIYNGINNYCLNEEVEVQLNPNYTKICTTSMSKTDVANMVNLGSATIDELVYDGEKLTTLVITSNKHKFTLCSSGTFAMDDEECDGNDDEDVVLVGNPIIEKAKKLVYDNNICKTDGTTYQYMNGCYIKGNPNNNYIWYSGFLWRIMGINADGTVRMITDENVTAIPWGEEGSVQNWDDSYAKDWLNNYFYPRLKGNNIIKEETWCSEVTTDSTSTRTECTNNLSVEPAKVGLLTLDEYNLADGTSSYLNIGQYQWTMTPYGEDYAWSASIYGGANYISLWRGDGFRAIINVNYDATVTGGNGTISTTWNSEVGPYILNEEKNVKITGKLNENAVVGEYVLFAGKKYRVVDKDSNGNIKLILDGYYEEEDAPFTMIYGNNNEFSISTGIGQKLNTDVLEWLVASSDTENRNKLVTNYTWYQNNFGSGDIYTVSINENNPTRNIKATVGLIRVGEILAGQSSNLLTKDYTVVSSYNNAAAYWTMTPYTSSTLAWNVYGSGCAYGTAISSNFALRPVIVVKSDVIINEGNGTWSNPYQI